MPSGPTLVYDEDGYYLGGVIAEAVRDSGVPVTLATPSDVVSEWAGNTSERWRVRTKLQELGIDLELSRELGWFDGQEAKLTCSYTGRDKRLPVANVVLVTHRAPNDALWHDLLARVDGDVDALPFTLQRIGDCEAPAIIAAAVYAGHRYARELEAEPHLLHDRVDVRQTPDGAHLAHDAS